MLQQTAIRQRQKGAVSGLHIVRAPPPFPARRQIPASPLVGRNLLLVVRIGCAGVLATAEGQSGQGDGVCAAGGRPRVRGLVGGRLVGERAGRRQGAAA